jgi:hypothetical protein
MLPAALLDALPAHTTFQHRSDGFQLNVPASLSGNDVPLAMVRVRNRVRPMVPVGAIFAGVRRELGFSPPEPRREQAIVTRDAECAAIQHITEGERCLSIGVVFGEDFYRLILGTGDQVMAIAVQHVVDRVTTDLSLGLAYKRRRWYSYAPPPGWGGQIRHRLVAEWMAPRFPNERALITVFPARPFTDTPAGAMDRHLHEMSWGGYVNESMEAPLMVTISERLSGVKWRLVGAWLDGVRTFTEVVFLQDGTFMYMMRLDHEGQNPEGHIAVLDTMVASVRPIPALNVAPSQSALAFMVE